MRVLAVNPTLNVSDIDATLSWFAKLGWTVGFEWQDDPEDPNCRSSSRASRAAIMRSSCAGAGRRAVEKDRTPRPLGRDGDQTSDEGV
jgi:hypothetical protein